MVKKSVCWMQPIKQQNMTCQHNFFVCVNTNVGYTIVGCFITANETKNSIMRGLQYFKDWNVNWHPKYFMTDFDTSEISAIEETFEGKKMVFLFL